MPSENKPRKRHPSRLSQPCIYTLRIELVDSLPLIWRRLCIDGRSSFLALHHVIQAAMGWHDAHLHQFEFGNRLIGTLDRDALGPPVEDERKTFLNRVLPEEVELSYLYDFGDSWLHRVVVEGIEASDDLKIAAGDAWVEAGEGACPPEDIGGVGQWQDFLERMEDEPYAEQTKKLREWVALDFDPDRYDRLAANAAIRRMLWNKWIK